MKRLLLSLLTALIIIATAFADGTVTTPANIAPATWAIANINTTAGVGGDIAGISITIYYFEAGGTVVQRSTVQLTTSEILSYFTTINSPVAGESGSAIRRQRQRVTKWLIDNGKIANVTPE